MSHEDARKFRRTASAERTPVAPDDSDRAVASDVAHAKPAGPPPPVGAREPRTAAERAVRAAAAKEAPAYYSSSSSTSDNDAGQQDGISQSSSFSLELRGEALDNARAEGSALYRRELAEAEDGRSARSRAGKHSWFQRTIAHEPWGHIRDIMSRQLTGARLLQWQNWCMAHARGYRKAGDRRETRTFDGQP